MGAIGCCSWSLKAASPEELSDLVRDVGVGAVQLALRPLREGAWRLDRTVGALREGGIAIRSGMMEPAGEDYSSLESIRRTGGIRPDETWGENRRIAREDARIAAELGLRLVTFHAGFLPHDLADPRRAEMIGRLREIADVFWAHGIRLGLETGQETAQTLLSVLAELDRPAVGVNFDPANMILYNMGDPVAALEGLASSVQQIHIKDAVRSRVTGEWGVEVPVGEGDVDWEGFFGVVAGARLDVDLMIEREAGDDRVGDMRRAVGLLREHGIGVPAPGRPS